MHLLIPLLAGLATTTTSRIVVAAVQSAAPPSPSCALNPPCPPPAWPPQWNLTLSTLCQPSSDSYFVPPPDKPWGLISLDWSVAEAVWRHNNQNDSTIEGTSIEGCRRIKAVSPLTRCFIYHNNELALQAIESQRAVMYDTLRANWFLQYTVGDVKTGEIYNEPGGPGDQYFWDFRSEELLAYWAGSVVNSTTSSNGLCGGRDCVDGSFADDMVGLPDSNHPNATQRMGLNASEVSAIRIATQLANQAVIDAAVVAGKYVWQAFGNLDGVGEGVTRAACIDFMRARCTPGYATLATTQLHNSSFSLQSIASFLVVRGPIAFLGFGWESDMKDWDPLFRLQVGEPLQTGEAGAVVKWGRDRACSRGRGRTATSRWIAGAGQPWCLTQAGRRGWGDRWMRSVWLHCVCVSAFQRYYQSRSVSSSSSFGLRRRDGC